MFLLLKLQRESYKYWKKHFNSPSTLWTAEFSMGWIMAHRPWLTMIAHLELAIELGLLVYVLSLYFKGV